MNKNVYVFLCGTKTKVSRLVQFFTCRYLSHSALSLDDKFDNMYTFGRFTLKAFPSGFNVEDIRKNILKKHEDCKCKVLRLSVTEEQFDGIKNEIEKYNAEREKYKYAVAGVVLCFFRIPARFRYRRFCSQFVADVLTDGAGIKMPRKPALMRPNDFTALEGAEVVFEGTIKGLALKTDESPRQQEDTL